MPTAVDLRRKADDIRRYARQTVDLNIRSQLESLATQFEHLADRIERPRPSSTPSPKPLPATIPGTG